MVYKPIGRIEFFTPEVARQQLIDWLFVETMSDLRDRSSAPLIPQNKYRIIGIAPLLRKLTLDRGKSLIHLVRRVPHRPTISFRATPYEGPMGIPPGAEIESFGVSGPELTTPGRSTMTLDQFHALRVGHIRGHDISARQLIRHYANVEGGVHLGKSEGPINDLLQFDAPLQPLFPRLPQAWSVLIGLAQIVTARCEDLRAVVAEQYEARRMSPSPEMLGKPPLFQSNPAQQRQEHDETPPASTHPA